MKDETKCPAKHTKYQPSDAEWKCPKCGATAGDDRGFVVDEPVSDTWECDKLHEGDFLGCANCEYRTTGKAFAARCQKAADMVPCPTCKGHGLVKGDAKPKPARKRAP